MKDLRKELLLIIPSLLVPLFSVAQQFIGLNTRDYSAIHHMATNPAWVNASENGMEIMLFSANGLVGNNAYSFKKKFIFNGFNGRAIEGKDYIRDPQPHQKHLWANIEINGPAISFKYKNEHHFGVFTRARQIYRAGNIASSEFAMLGQETPELFYKQQIEFRKAGFTTHTFAEIGFSYGRVLRNDYYNILRGGVSLKYLMGFVAGTIYTESLDYNRDSVDRIGYVKGDVSMLYTHNIGPFIDNNAQNDLTSWFNRAGRWGLGLDIGAQYEYHPNGTPNEPTPYLFSIAASLTDMGGIRYIADTGSGTYDVSVNNIDTGRLFKISYEGINDYMMRLEKDTLPGIREDVKKFRMGLPTAFRLNIDYNASENMNLAVNLLLNLRGNGGEVYRPAYVNYINFTPSFGGKNFKFGLPFTMMGYQTFAIGTIVRAGPFYIGSTSAISMIMSKKIRNIDGYVGFVWKFRENERHYF